MSAFSGPQGRGARRQLKTFKREEAEHRQRKFDAEVEENVKATGNTEADARRVVNSVHSTQRGFIRAA